MSPISPYTFTEVFTVIFLITVAGIGIGVDFVLRKKYGEPGTISAVTAVWSMKYPMIPALVCFLIGFLFGHLWWPNFAYCR